MFIAMLWAVVSEQQDDWDDQLIAMLTSYCFTPQNSMGVSPYCMSYGVEMTMPLDLFISDIGRERPGLHCSTDYMQWLCKSNRDAHAMARTNCTKVAVQLCQKEGLWPDQSNCCVPVGRLGVACLPTCQWW